MSQTIRICCSAVLLAAIVVNFALSAAFAQPQPAPGGLQPSGAETPAGQRGPEGRGARAGQDDATPLRGTRRGAPVRGGSAPGGEQPATATSSTQGVQIRNPVGTSPFGDPQQSTAEGNDPDAPKIPVAINLWVLTIATSKDKPVDELTAALIDKAKKFPGSLGSIDDAQTFVSKLAVAGVLERTREFHILTLNGRSSSVQAGANTPQIQSTSITQFGKVNSITYQPVGTLVRVLPRLGADVAWIQINLSYNASEIEKTTNTPLSEPANGPAMYADRITQQTFQTDAILRSGTAKVVHCDISAEPAQGGLSTMKMQLIILGAVAGPAGE